MDSGNVYVLGATYGPLDVTERVRQVYQTTNEIRASNDVFTDPWYGVVKTLTIVYLSGNQVVTRVVTENGVIILPGEPK